MLKINLFYLLKRLKWGWFMCIARKYIIGFGCFSTYSQTYQPCLPMAKRHGLWTFKCSRKVLFVCSIITRTFVKVCLYCGDPGRITPRFHLYELWRRRILRDCWGITKTSSFFTLLWIKVTYVRYHLTWLPADSWRQLNLSLDRTTTVEDSERLGNLDK